MVSFSDLGFNGMSRDDVPGKKPAAIVDGIYKITIKRTEGKKSKNGNMYLQVDIRVIDPTYPVDASVELVDRFVAGHVIAFSKYEDLLESAGLPSGSDSELLHGKQALAHIKTKEAVSEYGNKYYNLIIQKYIRPNSKAGKENAGKFSNVKNQGTPSSEEPEYPF